jgi:hypothetical protein
VAAGLVTVAVAHTYPAEDLEDVGAVVAEGQPLTVELLERLYGRITGGL